MLIQIINIFQVTIQYQLRQGGKKIRLLSSSLFGADVNVVNKNRYNTTPLIELTRNGNEKIGKLLLSKGAKINFVDVNNDPPINWATYYGQTELVKLLVNNDARIDIIGKDSGDDALAISKRMKT